jgi:hypothetical protein
MNKVKRLGLILTEREKYWVIRLAELEGGLSQAALIQRLIREAAQKHGLQVVLNCEVEPVSETTVSDNEHPLM